MKFQKNQIALLKISPFLSILPPLSDVFNIDNSVLCEFSIIGMGEAVWLATWELPERVWPWPAIFPPWAPTGKLVWGEGPTHSCLQLVVL